MTWVLAKPIHTPVCVGSDRAFSRSSPKLTANGACAHEAKADAPFPRPPSSNPRGEIVAKAGARV